MPYKLSHLLMGVRSVSLSLNPVLPAAAFRAASWTMGDVVAQNRRALLKAPDPVK